MKRCSKKEAMRQLGVSSTTFNRRAKNLDIEIQLRTTSKGRQGFILETDLQRMAAEMNVALQSSDEETENSGDGEVFKEENPYNQSEKTTKAQYELQMQLREQEALLQSKSELLTTYEQQLGILQHQVQTEQQHKSELFDRLIKTQTKYIGFKVGSIALGSMLVLFVVLSLTGVLRF